MAYQDRSHDRVLKMQTLPKSINDPSTSEEDVSPDADEPPDDQLRLGRIATSRKLELPSDSEFFKAAPLQMERRESLLTRALTSPELHAEEDAQLPPISNFSRGLSTASTCSNASAASTADLTSDGGLTSPTRTSTPSPPLPPTRATGFPLNSKPFLQTHPRIGQEGKDTTVSPPHESAVEAGLGRRRCIKFACGGNAAQNNGSGVESAKPENAQVKSHPEGPAKSPPPAKRACTIKFACPTQAPPQQQSPRGEGGRKPRLQSPAPVVRKPQAPPTTAVRVHRGSDSTVRTDSPRRLSRSPLAFRTRRMPSDVGLERSEATRFHEFASSFDEEDEWVQESTVHRHRLTVDDTLKKEKAFRQMGEEAEEEAEEEEEEEAEDEEDEDLELSDDDISEGGNETDNEEGFAESDDESDTGSDYQFWTPGRATGVTHTSHIDMIRPHTKRTASESSIESMGKTGQSTGAKAEALAKARKRPTPKVRHDTPELPDSTDFVCGTFDEDRPLEAAYKSCLEERKRAKHTPVPQDIDPSFPMSDPDDEEDEVDDDAGFESEGRPWDTKQCHDRKEGSPRGRKRNGSTKLSPHGSPKRLRSPPPAKRGTTHRSPPPRQLFGHSPHRLRSPPPARHLKSPPSTRRPSLAISPKHHHPIDFAPVPLAQRPHLTHTKSLPRTPNSFANRYHAATDAVDTSTGTSPTDIDLAARDIHNRGAIDIVKGLERKKQRRKEKLWQKHLRQAGKDKERKPQPGKGAERMRELGLEMAGKGRAYALGQTEAQYVLSF